MIGLQKTPTTSFNNPPCVEYWTADCMKTPPELLHVRLLRAWEWKFHLWQSEVLIHWLLWDVQGNIVPGAGLACTESCILSQWILFVVKAWIGRVTWENWNRLWSAHRAQATWYSGRNLECAQRSVTLLSSVWPWQLYSPSVPQLPNPLNLRNLN